MTFTMSASEAEDVRKVPFERRQHPVWLPLILQWSHQRHTAAALQRRTRDAQG